MAIFLCPSLLDSIHDHPHDTCGFSMAGKSTREYSLAFHVQFHSSLYSMSSQESALSAPAVAFFLLSSNPPREMGAKMVEEDNK